MDIDGDGDIYVDVWSTNGAVMLATAPLCVEGVHVAVAVNVHADDDADAPDHAVT